MTRATATFHNVEQRKRKHRAKSSKVMMKLISETRRSYGKQGRKKKKKKNKKIQFSSRETFGLGRSSRVAGKKLRQHHRRRRLKRMETELAKMKAEMRDSAESLMAGKVEADQAEAKLQVLKLKLLAVKEIEAFLMGFL
ncbi:hypothetical protein ES332_A11G273200v1 [Gossypium tomentosum]|nr:hypothetical protein ES332_A11G273200v1 [Gossypium tomentosum]TYI02535.1 hypothetical protein ES332_A11G273200v1 [Gossypium tomentosum]TYI02536.1 hypothetical protein ES332_A11G273200v1 [Gossypium tomentosum]